MYMVTGPDLFMWYFATVYIFCLGLNCVQLAHPLGVMTRLHVLGCYIMTVITVTVTVGLMHRYELCCFVHGIACHKQNVRELLDLVIFRGLIFVWETYNFGFQWKSHFLLELILFIKLNWIKNLGIKTCYKFVIMKRKLANLKSSVFNNFSSTIIVMWLKFFICWLHAFIKHFLKYLLNSYTFYQRIF